MIFMTSFNKIESCAAYKNFYHQKSSKEENISFETLASNCWTSSMPRTTYLGAWSLVLETGTSRVNLFSVPDQ
jgi:hypothetical protein